MNSKLWMTLLFSFAGIAVAVAAGAAIVMANDDGSDGGRGSYDACLEGSVECDHNPGDGYAAGDACLEGSTECDDIPVDSGAAGGAAGGTCLVGTIDCIDTPGSAREGDIRS